MSKPTAHIDDLYSKSIQSTEPSGPIKDRPVCEFGMKIDLQIGLRIDDHAAKFSD